MKIILNLNIFKKKKNTLSCFLSEGALMVLSVLSEVSNQCVGGTQP